LCRGQNSKLFLPLMEAINILSARLVRAAFAAFLLPLTIFCRTLWPCVFSRQALPGSITVYRSETLQRLNVRPSEPKWELCFAKEEYGRTRLVKGVPAKKRKWAPV